MLNIINKLSDDAKYANIGDDIVRFPNTTPFYFDDDYSNVYDVSKLASKDAVRRYIENNYAVISYEMLDRIRDDFYEDMDEFGYSLEDEYDFMQDIDYKEQQIRDRIDLSDEINNDVYNMIVMEMKDYNVYDSYYKGE